MSANPFAESTLGAMLDAIAARHPAREAMVFGDERVTFAEFRARADGLAAGLGTLGIGKGDKVAVGLPTRPNQ